MYRILIYKVMMQKLEGDGITCCLPNQVAHYLTPRPRTTQTRAEPPPEPKQPVVRKQPIKSAPPKKLEVRSQRSPRPPPQEPPRPVTAASGQTRESPASPEKLTPKRVILSANPAVRAGGVEMPNKKRIYSIRTTATAEGKVLNNLKSVGHREDAASSVASPLRVEHAATKTFSPKNFETPMCACVKKSIAPSSVVRCEKLTKVACAGVEQKTPCVQAKCGVEKVVDAATVVIVKK